MTGKYVFKNGGDKNKTENWAYFLYKHTYTHTNIYHESLLQLSVACSDWEDDDRCAPFDMPFHNEWNSSTEKRTNVSCGPSGHNKAKEIGILNLRNSLYFPI